MENDGKAKRPRVNLVPHTYEDPPVLQCGTHNYTFDEVTALWFTRVLFDWLYRTTHRDKGPSEAMLGDQ